MTDEIPSIVMSNQHEFRFSPPRRFVFTLVGALTEEDTVAYLNFMFDHADRHNVRCSALYDLSRFERLTDGARTRLMRVDRAFPLTHLAVVGTSFTIRVVCAMLIRAGKLVAPEKWGFHTEFFATKAEAQAWLEGQNV